jgi:hypothetical protein
MSAELSRDVLAARIVDERAALAAALGDLRDQARAELDLGRHVQERPSAWLAGALVVGLVLGMRR